MLRFILLILLCFFLFSCEPVYKRNSKSQKEQRLEIERIREENKKIRERNSLGLKNKDKDLVSVRTIGVLTLEGDTAWITGAGSKYTKIYIEK